MPREDATTRPRVPVGGCDGRTTADASSVAGTAYADAALTGAGGLRMLAARVIARRRMMSSPPRPVTGYSRAFDRALMLAGLAHSRQTRKGTAVPYLTHPANVAMIVARHGGPEPLLVAAALHDVLEDMPADDAQVQKALRETFPELQGAPADGDGFRSAVEAFIEREFGEDVARLVRGLTDEEQGPDGQRLSWQESKRRTHERLADPATPPDVVRLKCADSLHNARQVVNDLRAQGLPMMRRFNGTPEATLLHYASVWREGVRRFGATDPLVDELGEAVRELAGTLEEQFQDAHERVRAVMDRIPPAEGGQ